MKPEGTLCYFNTNQFSKFCSIIVAHPYLIFLFLDGRLSHDKLCIGARQEGSENDNHIELVPCYTEDTWTYDPRLAQLQHDQTGLCLKVTR